MKLKGVQLLILCLAVCILDGDARAPKKIRNGQDARENEFPYQVYLQIGEFACGGSIIAKDWILTAAHCFYTPDEIHYEVDDITVYAGLTDLRKDSIPNAVSELIVHRGFDREQFPNTSFFGDIALLKLTKPMKLDSHRKIILLPSQYSSYPLPGTEGILSGWGDLAEESTEDVEELQKLNMTVMTMEDCRQSHGNAITKANFCALGMFQHSGFCSGDSGGPLVANGRVIGIVSASAICGDDLGDIFTNVAFFTDWILSYIGSQKS